MLSPGDSVLVGLSGGPDSVCLLTVLKNLRSEFELKLHAAYIDHGLRPEETPREIAFCRDLCATWDLPVSIKRADVSSYAREAGLNKQEAARELRYRAFGEIALQGRLNKIALAHNADDQAETILMRLLRGTGPSGLSGIPPKRGNIIRPLIEIERREIERFLEEQKIDSLIDSSNLRDDYLRNRMRHHILPLMKNINRSLIGNILKTADIFRDEERYFEVITTKSLMRLITRKTENTLELFLSPLEVLDTVMLRRVLRRAVDETSGLRGITFVHIEDCIGLIKRGKPGDRIYLPGEVRVIKGYATLMLTSEKPARLGWHALDGPGQIVLKESSLVIRSEVLGINETAGYGDGKSIAVLDADKVSFPALIRARTPGDFFYPLGFGRKKKLQDYFVDQKVPRDERDTIPLLVINGEIAWVVGFRIDERYRVDKSTSRVLKFEVRPLKP